MEICKTHLLSSDSTAGFDQMLALLMFAQAGEKNPRLALSVICFTFHTVSSLKCHPPAFDQSPSVRTKDNLECVYLYCIDAIHSILTQ